MGKYNISKQFGIWAHFKPPRLTKFIAKIAQKFTGGMWRTLKRQKGIAFKRLEIQTGLKAFLISPEGCVSSDCLVYFHGGGFVFDAAFSHYKLACEYARRCGINVLFVRYTLVPNRVYPVQEKECLAAINYAKKGFDKVIVGGDSAGGFLAATSLIQSINTGIRLDGAMLIYPVIDNKMRTKSMMEFCDTPMWDSVNNKKMWQWYYGTLLIEESVQQTTDTKNQNCGRCRENRIYTHFFYLHCRIIGGTHPRYVFIVSGKR